MIKYFFLICLFMTSKGWAECAPMNLSELKKSGLLKKGTPLVFFASWCFDCKKGLEEAKKDSLAIALFDDKERAEKVYALTQSKATCIYDRDESIGQGFQVHALPYQSVYQGSP